jgi:aryl-alcohol dehydrogenase
MQIKAAVAREKGAPFSIETIELDEPRAEEILVRVVATGVCHTDLVVRDGHLPTPLPVVLGHEGAGIVEKVGAAVAKVRPGDHVVMTFNSCGHCPSCQDHHVSYCHEFFPRNFFAARADGTSALSKAGERINSNFFGQSSFASYALCHQANIVKVNRNLPLELLGPLACGIQTGAGAVMNAMKVSPGKSLAVFGAGSVGLAAVMAARVVGATTIIAVDLNESRLAMAKQLGATQTINPERANPTEEILAMTGYGVNFALDTTGLPAVIRSAAQALAPMGTCGILGAAPMGWEITLEEVHFMSGGRRLMGIVEGDSNPDVFIPMLAELYAQGRFPFDRLVKFYSFEQINEAVHDSETGVAIKPIVRM